MLLLRRMVVQPLEEDGSKDMRSRLGAVLRLPPQFGQSAGLTLGWEPPCIKVTSRLPDASLWVHPSPLWAASSEGTS